MHRPNTFFSSLKLIALLAICALSAIAQTENKLPAVEPNYEIQLNVILGSNDASQKTDLPAGFNGVARQLKSNFAFTNYRLVNTYLGRLGNNGNLEYKSIADIFGQEQVMEFPTFLDWGISGLRSSPDYVGKGVLQIQSFRFGARIPIRTANFKDDSGKSQSVVNYESVGLNLNRVSIGERLPVLLGTLSLPKTSGTAFLVLTVNPVEN